MPFYKFKEINTPIEIVYLISVIIALRGIFSSLGHESNFKLFSSCNISLVDFGSSINSFGLSKKEELIFVTGMGQYLSIRLEKKLYRKILSKLVRLLVFYTRAIIINYFKRPY